METWVNEVTEFSSEARCDLWGCWQPLRPQESHKIKIRATCCISSIAQLVERRHVNLKVEGSNLIWNITFLYLLLTLGSLRGQKINWIKLRVGRANIVISYIAQLVEHRPHIQKVEGSNLTWDKNYFEASYHRQPWRPKESEEIKLRVRRSNTIVFTLGWIRTHELLDMM